jgi:hypothetical protein
LWSGTGVWIYLILSNERKTRLNITVDNIDVGHFEHVVDPSGPPFLYARDDNPTWGVELLPYGNHTVKMSVCGSDNDGSWVNFDYAKYRCVYEIFEYAWSLRVCQCPKHH